MFVKFEYRPTETGKGEDGLPLFEDKVWITITRDVTHSIERPATEKDIRDFKEIYDGFMRENEGYEKLEGYPIDMWAALKPATIATFKARGIRTVQELAAATKAQVPGEFVLVIEKAKRFIELAEAGTGMSEKADKIASENESLKEELKEAKSTIGKLRKQLEAA